MPGPEPPLRILIVKLSSLGDVVHALPVAASLRATFPAARLGWVVERKWAPLVERHPALDQVLTIDSYGWRRAWSGGGRAWGPMRAAWRQVRAFQADCALDLQGTLKSSAVTWASRARHRLGWAPEARRERLAGWAYTHCVLPRAAHVVEQMLEMAAAVPGAGAFQRRLEFSVPTPPDVQREVDAWIASNRLGPFVFLSPGGGWAAKRWPSERYAQLAELLQARYGLAAVLNRGPGEQDMDDAYRRANAIRARLFSGDIDHLGAVLRRARLVVGGDTGPLQLAAALATPSVALFGPTDPARNGPYSPRCVVLRKTEATTYQRGDTYSPAMLAIAPAEVADACGELLARGDGAAS